MHLDPFPRWPDANMSSRSARCKLVVAIALTFLSGCKTVYRSETTLHSDGSLDRIICEEDDRNPRTPVDANTGKPIKPVEKVEQQAGPWQERIFSIQKRDGQEQQLISERGRFRTANDIPDYFKAEPLPGSNLPAGKLARGYTRHDYVFVVEHRWRETLTDVVQLSDMLRARDELAKLLIDYSQDCLNEAFGTEYEFGELLEWLRADGKAWFTEASDFMFAHCVNHKGPTARTALLDGLADLCAKHGLQFKNQGPWMTGDNLTQAVKTFLTARIQKHVRRKRDGQLVDEATARAWVEQFAASKGIQAPEGPNAWQKAQESVLKRRHGGKEAFDMHLHSLLTRVFGLYFFDLIGLRGFEFDYSMTVPGEVVETNGLLVSKNRVRWQFGGFDAYPFGYEMLCRSFEVKVPILANLPPGDEQKTREFLLSFVSIVSVDNCDALLSVLRECQQQKDLTPLIAYYLMLGSQNEESAKVSRVAELLGVQLPPQPDWSKVGDELGKAVVNWMNMLKFSVLLVASALIVAVVISVYLGRKMRSSP
jgi:hypothetical protein